MPASFPPPAIIVMGVSGAGKTTLARALALALHCAFIEGDSLHSTANISKMQTGTALSDADRWPWLDSIGAALNQATSQQHCAIATCSALKYAYRERLRLAITAPTAFILLEGSDLLLTARLQQRRDHFMPPSLLASQLATLEYPTPAEHALVLDAAQAPAALTQAALQWLATHAFG